MRLFLEYGPWFAAMGALVVASGFFSASESALFYLQRRDRREFASGGPGQRVAAELLGHPERLLSSILFCNLLINVVFFALASIVGLDLQRHDRHVEAGAISLGSLFVLIFLGEMVPKTLGVLMTRRIAALVSLPLAVILRAIAPVMPVLRFADRASRRLLWPNFASEPYLEINDLERAIEFSTSDAALVEQERAILRNIVALSETRVDELMRPRARFELFASPVAIDALGGRIPTSGYLFISERDSDDVAGAISLLQLWDAPERLLEQQADRVIYIPWCASAAAALEELRKNDRNAAAVINELGETIGVLTYEDLMEAIFHRGGERGVESPHRAPIERISPENWRVTGMTSLRRVARYFQIDLPESKALTVAGMLQETLQRMPGAGDECRWGPFDWKVLAAPDHGRLVVELSPTKRDEEPQI